MESAHAGWSPMSLYHLPSQFGVFQLPVLYLNMFQHCLYIYRVSFSEDNGYGLREREREGGREGEGERERQGCHIVVKHGNARKSKRISDVYLSIVERCCQITSSLQSQM